jgi:hypothetical protein
MSSQSPIQVISANGRVNVRSLAAAIDVPMDALAGALGKSKRWLDHDPEAASIQPAAISIVQMVNELAGHLGEKRYALSWLKTPQPEFGQQTPLDYLRAGHLDLVIGLANDILVMVPD